MADALNGTPELETLVISPTSTTSYFVVASSKSTELSPTCTTVEEIIITVNPLPVLDTTNAEICISTSIDLNDLTTVEADTSVRFYTSLADATLGSSELFVSTVTPTENTSYFVKAIDTNPATTTSCDQIKEIQIQVNPLPFVSTTDTQICFW